jgi:hypothetical protein
MGLKPAVRNKLINILIGYHFLMIPFVCFPKVDARAIQIKMAKYFVSDAEHHLGTSKLSWRLVTRLVAQTREHRASLLATCCALMKKEN